MDAQQLIEFGLALEVLGEIEEAVDCYRKAAYAEPAEVKPLYHLAAALARLGRYRESVITYGQILRTAPGNAPAHNNLANMYLLRGEYTRAADHYRQALASKLDFPEAHSNLLLSLLYDAERSPDEIFAEHQAWGRQYADPIAPVPARYSQRFSPDRRLRVGYVSADLYDHHPLPQFFEPILANHDPVAVETFCYANVASPDHLTAALQRLSAHWRDTHGMEDYEMAKQVRRDRIDILVDLGGHFGGNRLLAFARRPAPVQVTYLGYPATTGVRAIRYRITDEWADPLGETDHLHTEELVRLRTGFLCFQPLMNGPKVKPLPMLRTGKITFGCFNYRPKITAPVIRVWAEIMRRVPGSELLLHRKADLDRAEIQEDLRAAFLADGIRGDRIRFAPELPRREHVELYNEVDLALDTFPYNGQTTTCEALWMGVPVVSLAGKTHVSRVGVALLSSVGLTNYIARSPDAYVDIATRAVQDAQSLAVVRAKLRPRMASAQITQACSFVRALEEAYRWMWHRQCSEQDILES